jgi:starvation-inducible DNA-binding protein
MSKSNAKPEILALLAGRLADSIDLALIAKQAHWNLKGPQFIAIHEMLDDLRDDVDEYVDTIAERISALGASPHGTVQTVADKTSLRPYPTDLQRIEDHLRALVERYAATASAMRRDIDSAAAAGDAVTADVFTGIARGLDKWVWLLESHLHH